MCHAVLLETVAAVPGVVGGMLLLCKSLRRFEQSGGIEIAYFLSRVASSMHIFWHICENSRSCSDWSRTSSVVKEASFTHIARPARMPQKILLCGWRRDIDDMIVVWRGSLPKDFIVPKSAERILSCGWRRDMEDMIMVLDAFLAPGSELWMFNDVPENEREKKLIDGGLDFSRLENIQLVNREGNAVIRRQLESLPLHSFDSVSE
ncbi:hypothetical protein OIU85_003114 [Salix viminalis]|uniref:Ubiquinol oxidase n=1 Tax=Salix viminalis TaxID=40686 RepID=A0A9Q0PYF5_SALVM|nr:hypothetical protein OIU85_003114 [Salix viminalis]